MLSSLLCFIWFRSYLIILIFLICSICFKGDWYKIVNCWKRLSSNEWSFGVRLRCRGGSPVDSFYQLSSPLACWYQKKSLNCCYFDSTPLNNFFQQIWDLATHNRDVQYGRDYGPATQCSDHSASFQQTHAADICKGGVLVLRHNDSLV